MVETHTFHKIQQIQISPIKTPLAENTSTLLLQTFPTQQTEPLIQAFLSGRNERTIRAYRQDLEDFRLFLQAKSLSDAARILIMHEHGEANRLALAYKTNLMNRGLQPATINRRLASLRSLVNLAQTLGIIAWSLEVKNLRSEPYRDTRGPGHNTLRRLLEEAGKQKVKKAQRDKAILRLLYDLGLRRGEVVALNLEDVDPEASRIAVLGKGHTQKIFLSLPDPTKTALLEWMKTRGPEPGPLFIHFDRARKGDSRLTGTSLYRIVRDLGQKIGLRIRPHSIRHTAITEACKLAQDNQIDLEEVLDFSRHKDVKVLMLYRDRERNVQGRLAALVASQV